MNRTVACYGCTKTFSTYPSMIHHLESGMCDSELEGADLNKSAAECYQWREFMEMEYRDGMLESQHTQEEVDGTAYPFKCPTCDNLFSKLSGLFQHVETRACDQRLDI